MTRSKLRESIFKILFRVEFNPIDEMQEQIGYFFEDAERAAEEAKKNAISDEDRAYIEEKTDKIIELIPAIDEKLSEASEGWTVQRLGKAELAILRLALYEIIYDDDIPAKVAINEAVNLTKTYCNQEAPAFVNGVLSRFC